jgi:hypothetical protein
VNIYITGCGAFTSKITDISGDCSAIHQGPLGVEVPDHGARRVARE